MNAFATKSTFEKFADVRTPYPKVSIGVPTFNGATRIGGAIKSIIAQKYKNLEIIISDNCSSDSTQGVCKALCEEHDVIRYYRQLENIGITRNFEFVLRKATGELFMWIADDDSLEPGILIKYVDFMLTNPDYSLVSGEIQYWSDQKARFREKDFSIEHHSGSARMLRYYSKVKHGAIYYGLMPAEIARQISLQNRMGEDWHFVAKAAYLGKIKMLNCLGYHKRLNGASKTLQQYARLIGAQRFSGDFPHVQIAVDAFAEVMTSNLYQGKNYFSRLCLASASMTSILFNYYFREYPFIVGGKILRAIGIRK